MIALSSACALVAALLFAVSASLQQTAARSTALSEPRRGSAFTAPFLLVARLLRQPLWLLGLGANVAGFVGHAVALRLGHIPTVQALLVVQLLFALPLAAARRKMRPLPRDWIGTGLVCVGLIVLVVQDLSHGAIRQRSLPYGILAICGVVALLVAIGSQIPVRHTQARAALFGIAAGCCSATTAVLVVVGTSALPHITWPLVGIVVSTLCSGLLAQTAFASGSLPTALTSMTVTDPTMSYLATITLFTAAAHPNPAALVCAAALVLAGVVLIANSPMLHDERDPATPLQAARR